jgi:hypothetical protein
LRLDAAANLLLVADGELAYSVTGEEVYALLGREGNCRVRALHSGKQQLAVVFVRFLLRAAGIGFTVNVVVPAFFVLALQ